jgi:D-alanyl-lipoteichoic acid acyltransferase DltB (MBOAT superfamily)
MLFNTIDFVIFFIIVCSTIAAIKHRKFQHVFLLVASYFFFYYTSNYLIILLIASTILDFYIAKAIWKTSEIAKKKILLIISLAGNLGLLGFFKYADFAILQFNLLGEQFNLANEIPFLNLVLPIGISFYTFQTISYTVDVYRGKLQPSESFKEFALFVAFFPQLVAGPIVRAVDFLPQLREKMEVGKGKLKLIIIHNSNLKLGVTIMAFGFLKKMFFADNIAPLVNDIFNHPIGSESFTIILGAIAFGIQIYGDFSGYTDIAIGAALILGFKLPINFNKPYFATSPADFWRRWHISLSTWLRDYLYIPLGGSKKSHSKTYLNLAAVMFLGGLWHGASWNFVIWGMLHGVYLALHRLLSDKFPYLKESKFFKSKSGKIISIFVTQYFVFLAWIPFRVQNTEYMLYSMQKYLFLDFAYENTFLIISQHKFEFSILIIFFILHFISYYKIPHMAEKISNLKLRYWFIVLLITIIPIFFFYDGNSNDFIYFQF